MSIKSKLVLLVFTVLNTISVAHGDAPVCHTLTECQSLSAQVGAESAEFKRAPKLGPIARNRDGSVDRMTQREAISYCATRGGLPTAKQMALALNPNGVSEVAREGFYRIAPVGEAPFYYNNGGYDRPAGDEGNYYFWSSSVAPRHDGYAFFFDGTYGGIYYYNRDVYYGAVRCVSGR